MVRNFAKKLQAFYHCVNCSAVLATLRSHAEVCSKVGRENPNVSHKVKPNKRFNVPKVKIEPTTDNFETQFLNFLTRLIGEIQAYGYLKDESFENLVEKLKKDMDSNFVEFFYKYHTKTIKYRVDTNDENFHIIKYYSQRMPSTGNSKSQMFQIEIASKKVISIHRLEAIRDNALNKNDEKCHYEGCVFECKYTNTDTEILVGHVLANNVLIVCFEYKFGFQDFEDYEKHIKPDCWLKRKAFKVAPNARVE